MGEETILSGFGGSSLSSSGTGVRTLKGHGEIKRV